MEADFINAYIARQKNWIEDLLAKYIMMEAKLQLSETRVAEKTKEIEQANLQLEEKNNYINKLAQSNNDKQKQIEELIGALEAARVAPQDNDQLNRSQKKKKTEQPVSADEF